ncbi:MAG: RNA 2',3'-cyclic phosphodiesterase [Planctomycetota bacterium]
MRLFVAIELSAEVKAALRDTQRALAAFDRAVRWVNSDQMHLTLKFLGEVPDGRVEEICATTASVAGTSSAFEMLVGGCGCFPPKGTVRVVWVGVDEPRGLLATCSTLCEAEYEKIGFAREHRPFSPHLTLGRVREDRTGGKLREAVSGVHVASCRQGANELCVVQSTLTPHGAKYAVVSRHPFGGAQSG